MRLRLLLVLVVVPIIELAAQTSQNAVFIEVGGSAIIPSVNYERRFTERWFGHVGASLIQGTSGEDDQLTIVLPVVASWVSRPQSNHHLEAGGGLTFAFGDEQDLFDEDDEEELSTAFPTGVFGYRYQRPDGGFQFRAVFTPVLAEGDVIPWAGVSFGYAW